MEHPNSMTFQQLCSMSHDATNVFICHFDDEKNNNILYNVINVVRSVILMHVSLDVLLCAVVWTEMKNLCDAT